MRIVSDKTVILGDNSLIFWAEEHHMYSGFILHYNHPMAHTSEDTDSELLAMWNWVSEESGAGYVDEPVMSVLTHSHPFPVPTSLSRSVHPCPALLTVSGPVFSPCLNPVFPSLTLCSRVSVTSSWHWVYSCSASSALRRAPSSSVCSLSASEGTNGQFHQK